MKEPKQHREVVRLRTSYWQDKRGIHIKKDLIPMRKMSFGYQILEEDAPIAGVDQLVRHIVNLHELKDGLYESVTCNESRDWETGYVDEYDYKLIPFKEEL